MKKKIAGLFLLLVFFGSCSDSSKYWPLEKFTLQPGVLKEGEKVRLLYYSGRHSSADEYLAQVLAVSEESGDTVNIMVLSTLTLEQEDGDKTFLYYSFKSPVYMQIAKQTKNWESEEAVLKNIKKVTRDSRHDDLSTEQYPACIGIIAKVTKEADAQPIEVETDTVNVVN